MEPIFTLQYGEFRVADYLANMIGVSVFVPSSAQQKGIDLLLYRHENGRNKIATIQVKMSRTYYIDQKLTSKGRLPYDLWYNRFEVPNNADWVIFVGIYAKLPTNEDAKTNSIKWDTIMLALKNEEAKKLMANLKQKKDSSKPDKMFGFAFDDEKNIYQTRGCQSEKVMSEFLIENRLKEIAESLS